VLDSASTAAYLLTTALLAATLLIAVAGASRHALTRRCAAPAGWSLRRRPAPAPPGCIRRLAGTGSRPPSSALPFKHGVA
jgi:hypothetical protein